MEKGMAESIYRKERKSEVKADISMQHYKNARSMPETNCVLKSGKITDESAEYPALLKEIQNAPKEIFYRGRIYFLKYRCVAVVGTRKPTEYGRWAAYKISKRLAEAGLTVVSGMAAGIDTLAHKGALAAGGRTIAVLGCGINICFPASNKALMREIEKRGLIISEYPNEYPAAKFTFPRRNRIISGLCEAVIVIEAGLASGSLITAELAAEQGRTVYALPGNINNVMSIGTNKLICDGARPIAVVDDLLWDLGARKDVDRDFYATLSEEEKIVIRAIEESGEATVNLICEKIGASPGKVGGIVTVLEMKGIICAHLGKIFIAK